MVGHWLCVLKLHVGYSHNLTYSSCVCVCARVFSSYVLVVVRFRTFVRTMLPLCFPVQDHGP